MQFAVGSDPEVFLVNNNGDLVSAIGTVGGSKKFPRMIPFGSVQEDNVLLEFNTKPATSSEDFVFNHMDIMRHINHMEELKDLKISIQATGYFDDSELTHPKARVAGCEPDYNAWLMGMNQPPDLSATNLRSGAGHLHISTDWMGDQRNREGAVERCRLVKALDIALGIPSVMMDDDTTRRSLYGKAGCHRPKFTGFGDKYNGVEYRTLSNFWLSDQELMAWAYENVEYAISCMNDWNAMLDSGELSGDEIQRIINESDVDAAMDLIDELSLEVVVDV